MFFGGEVWGDLLGMAMSIWLGGTSAGRGGGGEVERDIQPYWWRRVLSLPQFNMPRRQNRKDQSHVLKKLIASFSLVSVSCGMVNKNTPNLYNRSV